MMAIIDVPTPIALLSGLMVMALSAHYMTARSKNGMLARIAAFVNLTCILNASLGVNIVMAVIYLLVRPFSASVMRKLNSDFAEAIWADAVSTVMPPTKLIISGDMPDDETQAIVIANHQVDSDWWFIWEIMRRVGRHGALKIILKDDQKHVPITGWGMRGFGFIFLKRDWTKDRDNLLRQLQVFTGDSFPLRLLIFPEGTTINERSMEKCTEYAKKEQRPTFEHLLLPRTTGFGACVNAFSRAKNAGERAAPRGRELEHNARGQAPRMSENTRVVYDFTIGFSGYHGEIPTWEMGFTRNMDVDIPNLAGLLKGRIHGPVHIHIERHMVSDIASGDVKSWLDATWARKDAMLDRFIKDQKFPHEPIAKFESRKGPLAFLMLSAAPFVAGWLIYHGLVDLISVLSTPGALGAESTSV